MPKELMEVLWSPFKDDEFAAYNSDLYLFKIINSNQQNSSKSSNKQIGIYLVITNQFLFRKLTMLLSYAKNQMQKLLLATA